MPGPRRDPPRTDSAKSWPAGTRLAQASEVENGVITEEIGLDDGVTALSQLGLIKGA
jgi:hypothetical protein